LKHFAGRSAKPIRAFCPVCAFSPSGVEGRHATTKGIFLAGRLGKENQGRRSGRSRRRAKTILGANPQMSKAISSWVRDGSWKEG
jgi:hypothetical protein